MPFFVLDLELSLNPSLKLFAMEFLEVSDGNVPSLNLNFLVVYIYIDNLSYVGF
jgi:hypothetical protein